MKLTHPSAHTVSAGGKTYTAEKGGVFDVPDELAAELITGHGFASAESEPRAETRKAAKDDGKK